MAIPPSSQASRRAHALSCSRAAMPPALPRSHNFCRERVRSASTAYRRFEPASFCVCTCLLLWLQLMGRSAGCVGASSRYTPCLSLQLYGSGAHGVCKITGGSAAKFQGVPGGSRGFRGVPASHGQPSTPKNASLGDIGAGVPPHVLNILKLKKGNRATRTTMEEQWSGNGGLLELYASPLLGHLELYACFRGASRPAENKHTSL